MTSRVLTFLLLLLGVLYARSLLAKETRLSNPFLERLSSYESPNAINLKPRFQESNLTDEQCREQKLPELVHFKKLRNGMEYKVRVSYFEPFDVKIGGSDPGKVLIMILGPKHSFRESRDLIHTFCVQGNFRVVAFDVVPRKRDQVDERMYLKTAREVSAFAYNRIGDRPFILFGAEEGAQTAIDLQMSMLRKPKTRHVFQRVILVDPQLDGRFAFSLRNLSAQTTRIYACTASDIKNIQFPFLIPRSTARSCPRGVTYSPETIFPLVSSVESDAAGLAHIAIFRDWKLVSSKSRRL